MNNEPISKILARRINAMGLSRQFNAARVCAVANEVSDNEFSAVSFKNSVLKVRVDSNPRAHLVKLREKEIIEKINKELKREVVKKLVFQIE